MRAFVDQDGCIGCALCVSMCEDVFSINEDGLSEAIEEEISISLEDNVTEACEACPVEAISIKE